jgi:cyanophycinase-like exopeptidase
MSEIASPANGLVALVGSGEYLPVMQEFEAMLLEAGPSKKYVQLATAAGRESDSRLQHWRELGKAQADRVGAEQIFLPVFNREDAMREDFASQIDGAGLIYLSGGDPHYLAETLMDTPVYEAIIRNWKAGSSLAGCSAGAMAMGPEIPHFRKLKEVGSPGFNLIPHIRTIPHYNKFFKWIPDAAVQIFLKAPAGITIVGIDEDTAMFTRDLQSWEITGTASVHILSGDKTGKYNAGDLIHV